MTVNLVNYPNSTLNHAKFMKNMMDPLLSFIITKKTGGLHQLGFQMVVIPIVSLELKPPHSLSNNFGTYSLN
jgi:hypothetical protein